jgi:hypothetical protein
VARLSSIYREFSVNARKFIHTRNKTSSSATRVRQSNR